MRFQFENLATRTMMLLAFLLIFSASRTYAQGPLENEILERVASEQGLALQQLRIGALEPFVFPLAGVTLYQAKVVDTTTGDVYGVVVDENGETRDLEDTRLAERTARVGSYGRLHPALYERLQTMGDEDRLTVAVWLRADDLSPMGRQDFERQPTAIEVGDAQLQPIGVDRPKPAGPLEEKTDREGAQALSMRVAAIRAQQVEKSAALEAVQQASLDHLAGQLSTLQQPFLAHLDAQGFAPTYVSSFAPLIYVELPKSAILALAQRADVDTIYGPNQNFDALDSARRTQKADIIDWWGFDGTGVNVAILEDSRIEFNNPYLNPGTTRVPGDPNVSDHATGTAGIVASQHGTYQGIAQGAYLFSANATDYSDANLSAAMEWASTQGANIISNGWGGNFGATDLNVHDRHLDYLVRNAYRTVVVAAGNQGAGTGYVTSPGRGYNVITVGNYEDQGTFTWDDDNMNVYSSYVNPSTGVEKPEVAAVGSSINSTTASSPWTGNIGSGTSWSAPMVAGEAALLMDRDSVLKIWPEAVKAIIMVTALHNIEGDSRLSDYDGAGGVDMRAAFRVVDEKWWGIGTYVSGDFPYSFPVYAFAGETVRAAIAWDSNPAPDYSSDPLEADLDLTAYDPDGIPVAFSWSTSNNYEIVEFSAPKTGLYELSIDAYSFKGAEEFIGFAFWPGHRVLTDYVPQTWKTPPTAFEYFRFEAGSYWNAVGVRPPAGSDYDISLYANSAFADPEDHDWLEDSTLPGDGVDFVVVDRNHAPAGSYYPEVNEYDGSGDYPIEWATRTSDIVGSGTYGPYTMNADSVVRVWDISLGTGCQTIRVNPQAGTADLGVALFDSDAGDSATFYQGRSQAVASADANGAGVGETLQYTNSESGEWMGLVVFNNSSASATFSLSVDTCKTYLPIIMKPGPPRLWVQSVNTGGINPVEIRDPNSGDALLLTCVILPGEDNSTKDCGTFPPIGTYKMVAYTANCGTLTGTFHDALPGATVTRLVKCN